MYRRRQIGHLCSIWKYYIKRCVWKLFSFSGGDDGEDFVLEGFEEGNWYRRMATLDNKYKSFSTVSIDDNIFLYGRMFQFPTQK